MDRLASLVDNATALAASGYYRNGTSTPGRSLAQAIRSNPTFPVIAEVKVASPSRGFISAHAPAALIDSYRSAGAAGLSVLTEPNHFKGSLDDLASARVSSLPLLMKDIVVSAPQISAGASHGASAVLLIQEVFSGHPVDGLRDRLIDHAHALGLEVVLEAGSDNELERAASSGADMLGINQRDLRTFDLDLEKGRRLLPTVKGDGRPVVVMSGIGDVAQVEALRDAGADAVLVGTSLSSSQDPGESLRRLVVRR